MTADRLLTVPRGVFVDAIAGEPAPVRRAALRHRCRSDLWLFCATYLPARFTDRFSRMHHQFLAREKIDWHQRTDTQRIADAAPRENAKSTIVSWASVIHDVVYGIEAYVCLLSTTFDLSEDLVKDLYEVLTDGEQYPELHADFGPITVAGSKTDFIARLPDGDARGCRVKAFSFGGSIRGTKHAGIRPTKVIIDDGEHPDKARSATQRARTWQFLVRDVLKAGGRGTTFRVVGTVLHPESMLERILTDSPGWRATRWKSIESWPDRTDLWDRCKRRWADLTDPDRTDTARRFYERHRAEMDRGAVVLWPAHESLYDLMVLRWSDGDAAFSFEKQNVPIDPNRQIFYPGTWRRCQVSGTTITTSAGRLVDVRRCDVAGWLDPRSSRQIDRNDYAAAPVVARERTTGQIFVLSCFVERVVTARQLRWMWSLYDLYPWGHFGYEDNGFAVLIGDLFNHQRAERRAVGRSDQLALRGYCSTENKMDRIISLQPRIDLGWVEFADTLPGLLVEQFRAIPTGTHDDAPDAVERAIWLLDGPPVAVADLGIGWSG